MLKAAEFPGPLLTVQEVAERLKMNQRTVRKLLNAGKLAFINVGAATKLYRRVPVTEIERFLRERFVGRA